MTETDEASPNAIGREIDIVALGRRALAVVAADPLVHVGACVLVVAGSLFSLTVVAGPLLVGYIRLVERALRGEPVDFVHLGLGFEKPAAAFLAWLVFVLAVFVLLLAFVLPGLCLAMCWMFAFWFVALRGSLAAESLKKAWGLTQAHPGVILLIALVVVLVNLVGVLTIVGGLFSVPISLTFMTLCFQELTQDTA